MFFDQPLWWYCGITRRHKDINLLILISTYKNSIPTGIVLQYCIMLIMSLFHLLYDVSSRHATRPFATLYYLCKKYNYLGANVVVIGKNDVLSGSVWCYSNYYNYYMIYIYYILNLNNMESSKSL